MGGRSISILRNVETDRRAAAPHPGPILKRDFLDPLEIGVEAFAAHVGLDPVRLAAIFNGEASLDVDAAIRFARALGVPPERVMQMQTRFDFAAARGAEQFKGIEELQPAAVSGFPSDGFLSGNLGMTADSFGGGSLFFQERLAKKIGSDTYAGLHALWKGDRLRIYDPSGTTVWTGPLLQNLDGKILLPYVKASVSVAWFASGYPADLAIGADHAAFFERMRNA